MFILEILLLTGTTGSINYRQNRVVCVTLHSPMCLQHRIGEIIEMYECKNGILIDKSRENASVEHEKSLAQEFE